MDVIKKKIVIVEDDQTLRTLLADHLRKNYEVIEADNGQKGLAEVVTSHPDLVLLDLLLPNLSGFDLLEQVRNHPNPAIARTKVIILSNLTSNDSILKAQVLSVSDYLVKANTDLSTVYDKIDRAINDTPTQPKQLNQQQ